VSNFTTFFAGAEATPQTVADRVNERVLMGRMTQVERDELIQYMGAGAPTTGERTDSLALTIGGPTFQWF
jgi:hypothetical protein